MTPPMCTTMNPANNATMSKPCNHTNAAANMPQMIAIFATSARNQAPSAFPPLAPRDPRSTLCAKYAVGTRLLTPPTSADSAAARPNGIEAAAAVAVSRHWTQKTRLINGRIVRQCVPHGPRAGRSVSPPSPSPRCACVHALAALPGRGRAIVRVMVPADQRQHALQPFCGGPRRRKSMARPGSRRMMSATLSRSGASGRYAIGTISEPRMTLSRVSPEESDARCSLRR